MVDRPALFAGLTTVVVWGSAFVAIRAADEVLAPGAIALGRLVVSCSILTAVACVRREPLPPRSSVLPIVVFGVLWLGVYSVTLNAAERRVDAGTSAMIVNTGPLLIAILAGVFLREGFPRGLLGGCCVALGGCVAIGLATGARTGSATGLALLVVATLAYSSAVVVQKVALTRATAFQVTWLGCVAALVACLPFAPQLAGTDDLRALAWTLYLGVMPTALGFATWSFALRRADAGRVASLNYLIPVVAISLGWAYLGERPPLLAVGGGALCVAGVYLARRDNVRVHRLRAASGSVLFLFLAPGVVAGLVPWLLTGWRTTGAPGWLQALGWVVLTVGAAVLLEAFVRFVVEGVGTPAPAAPTERLVVGGLYRYVRNPMYLAVAAVILGQAAVLGRWELIAYAFVFGLTVWSFVHWYEEPTLRRQFGPVYDEYRAAVPGWWPRRPRHRV